MFWHRVRNTLPQIVAICSLHQVQDVLLCPRQTPTRHLFLMRNSAECWILSILDCLQHLVTFSLYYSTQSSPGWVSWWGSTGWRTKAPLTTCISGLLLRVEPSFIFNHWWLCPFHWPFMPEESQRQIVATMKRAVLFLAWGCMLLKSVKEFESICMDITWHLNRWKGLYNRCPRLFWVPPLQALWTHSPNL